ncbi:26031_t:CDS:1, partial [Racocetra persica]
MVSEYYEDFKIQETSIIQNYEIIAPFYLTIPIDDTLVEFYSYLYDSEFSMKA